MVLTVALEKEGYAVQVRFKHLTCIQFLLVMQVSLGGAVCICATCRDSGAGGRSRQHQHDMAAWGRVSRVAHRS